MLQHWQRPRNTSGWAQVTLAELQRGPIYSLSQQHSQDKPVHFMPQKATKSLFTAHPEGWVLNLQMEEWGGRGVLGSPHHYSTDSRAWARPWAKPSLGSSTLPHPFFSARFSPGFLFLLSLWFLYLLKYSSSRCRRCSLQVLQCLRHWVALPGGYVHCGGEAPDATQQTWCSGQPCRQRAI